MHNEEYVQITDLITDQAHPPFNKPKKTFSFFLVRCLIKKNQSIFSILNWNRRDNCGHICTEIMPI